MSNVGTTRKNFGAIVADPSETPDTSFNAITDFLLQYNKQSDDTDASAAITEHLFGRVPSNMACEIVSAYYAADAALTAHDTNYATLNINVRDGAGGAAVVACSQTTKITGGSGNLTAFVPTVLTLDTTKKAVAAGSVLTFNATKAAAGVAVKAGVFTVHLRRV